MSENNKVIIYTSSLCSFCYKAKSLLQRKKIVFLEINIDINNNFRSEMIKKTKGKTSVPQIFFGDYHIGGCDELYKLEQENGLKKLS